MTLPLSPFDAFARVAARDPGLVFLTAPAAAALPYAPTGLRYTYGEAAGRIAALRQDYLAAGLARGMRVALLLENRPEFFFHWLALNALGVSIVPINPDLRPAELRHQLTVAQPVLVVRLEQHAELVAEGTPEGITIVTPGAALPALAPPTDAVESAHLADECALLFTSGSTGLPKGCMLSNGYFINVAEWYTTLPGIAAMTMDAEIALTPLPFFHMNALGCTAVGMMLVGGAIVPIDRFSARRWWDIVADSRATIVHNLGVIPAILLQLPKSESETRHVARFNFSPGVDAQHKLDFEARFGLPIVEGWAMTETGGAAVTCTSGYEYTPGLRCIGAPRAGMDYRIVDDSGADLPVGQAGELWVRAAGADPRRGFFSGYLGDAAATEAAWEGGWFHTGDIVSVDADGLFYFVDRKKSIIRRSGENIPALEVEAALKNDPAVAEVAVTPVRDEIRGEEVFAFIRRREETSDQAPEALARDILTRAAAGLSYHKLPGYVAFVTALPVGATQKLQRGQLRVDAEQALSQQTAIDLRAEKTRLRTGA